MAGRARHKAITQELETRVLETFQPDPEDSDQPTGLDYVCHRVEGGTTTKTLAKELEDALGFPFDYATMMRYLRSEYGTDETNQAIDQARTHSAHAHADDSIIIVDEEALTSQDVTRAANRSKARQWLASRYNPKYGQQTQTNVNVSIGSLHLEALRAPIAVVARPAGDVTTALPAPVAPSVVGSRARLISTTPEGYPDAAQPPANVADSVTPGTSDNAQPAGNAGQD